jgi:hypothetical protein
VNLVCDAGTVANVKVVHHGLADPARLPEISRFEPSEHENWTTDQYEGFCAENCAWLSEYARRMEICGVICDNLPAHVVRLLQFLRNTAGINSAIIRISCLNHMMNLVFAHIIKSNFFSEMFATLLQCQKLIRTMCVDLGDVVAFLIDQINDRQTVLAFTDVALITAAHRRAYLV